MVTQNERGQNTHGQGERVKIPLLPNKVGKKSANNVGPQKGHDNVNEFTFFIYNFVKHIFFKRLFSE